MYNEEHHKIWLNPAGSQGRFLTAAVGLDLNTEPTQPGGLVGTLSSVNQPGLVVYELRVRAILQWDHYKALTYCQGLIVSVKAPDGRSHLAAIIKGKLSSPYDYIAHSLGSPRSGGRPRLLLSVVRFQ